MRCLVTGSAGFMGSHVADRLREKGYEVFGCDDLSGGILENVDEKKQTFTMLDLKDRPRVVDYINNVKPEVIYFMAATAREGASQFSPWQMTDNNFLIYMNTLVAAIKAKCLKKVVLFSSMAVYGAQQAPFDETMPRMPEDVYAVSKTAMERNTEILSRIHNFSYTVIRPHNVFGERQSMTDKFRNVIAIFMNRILRGEPIYIYGDGEQYRAFSYIFDSLDCYVKCLDSKVDGEVINIGGMTAITVNDLAQVVIKAMGEKAWRIEHLEDRPCEVKNAYCAAYKSQQLLGYKEDIGWEKGIYKMAEWAKKKGPQEWSVEELEIYTPKTPLTWYPDFDSMNSCRGEYIQ